MPSLEMRLARVLRYEPVMLLSRLRACINMLPAIEAIRWCHRFGQGDIAITRLPVELSNVIEELLLCQKRTRLLKKFTKTYLCLGNKCDWDDHFEQHEMDTILRVFHDEVEMTKLKKNWRGMGLTPDFRSRSRGKQSSAMSRTNHAGSTAS